MSDFNVLHQKAACFYETYERKAENQHQTHYCPGCGHGIVHKLIAEAIDGCGVQDRTVLISPVGCSVFAYYYFDVGNIQVAHGRAPAAATAVKRSLPHATVIAYQGDGDLAAIGTAEILHAANRGEPITVIFVNNAIYGMTGGQTAPPTPLGAATTTAPHGRSVWNEGYPLHVSEVIAALEAPVYVERVALGNPKMILRAGKAIRKAIENQVSGLGFSLVEILSPCPTIWKMTPTDAQAWVRDELTKVYPLSIFRDTTAGTNPRPAPPSPVPLSQVPAICKSVNAEQECKVGQAVSPAVGREADIGNADHRIKIAGFGGQGVLMLGELLVEAGLAAGLEVSWLPSYGPEMRSGTSHCHVRLCSSPVDSPLISRPTVLIAMNEPSLHKFLDTVEPGGWVLYNSASLPQAVGRDDVNFIVQPFASVADCVGDPRAANMVALGALLECTDLIAQQYIETALARLVTSQRWLEIDRKALVCGRDLVKSMKEPVL
jgi:2-oxoisovalerate ferredoxin oxidoreductase beta subunit